MGSHVLLDRLSPFKDEISLGFRLYKKRLSNYLNGYIGLKRKVIFTIEALGRAYGPTTGFTGKEEAKLSFTERDKG